MVVDDLLLATDSADFAETFGNALAKTYKLSVMGQPKWMIGLKVGRHLDSISLSQERYILDMAERFGQADCNPVCAPANHSLDLLNTTSDLLDLNTHNFLALIGF